MTTKDVLALALEALKRSEDSIGSFVSDHGWSQSDMDNLDTVTAAITAIKQAQQAQEPVGAELAKEVKALAEWHSKTSQLWPIGMEQSSFHNKAAITLFAVLKPAPKQAEPDLTAHEQRCADVATAMFRNRAGKEAIKTALTGQAEPEATDFSHGYDIGYEAGRLHASVPEGYKLVPVEPTKEMFYAIQNDCDILTSRAKRVWATMLAAAPTPPEAK